MHIMEYTYIVLSLFAASQVMFFMLVMIVAENPNRLKIPAVAVMVGVCSYLIMPLVYEYTPYANKLQYLWFFAAISPSMLLLFVWFSFEEECSLPPWLKLIVVISIFSSLYFQFAGGGLPASPLWLQALKIIIALLCVYVVWHGRNHDLVELRAKLRIVFITSFTCILILVLVIEVITDFDPPVHLKAIISMVILVSSILLNYFFLTFNPTGRLMNPPPPIKRNTDDPMLAELLLKMKQDRLYADHDIRLSNLAELIKLPEYKLREKINQELGYRNFNQFVNHYRIEEAGVRLREESRTPVLSIALDVGFRSISSFNTAFQTHFGLSPTRYRAEILSDS